MPIPPRRRRQQDRLSVARQVAVLRATEAEIRAENALRRTFVLRSWSADASALTETRRIARLEERLRVETIIGCPVLHPPADGRRGDRFVLGCVSHALLSLDQDRFETELGYLIESLELRWVELSGVELSMQRLNWWCRAVTTAAGFLQLANRQFLYRRGTLLSDHTFVVRLEELAASGTGYLDHRFRRNVDSVPDWIGARSGEDQQARVHLAGALNYLARDSFEHGSADPLHRLVKTIEHGHLDMVMTSAQLPVSNYTSKSALLYQAIHDAIDRTADYFDPMPGSECTRSVSLAAAAQRLLGPGETGEDQLALVFRELMRAAAVHARQDVVETMAERFELTPPEIMKLTGRPQDGWDERLLDSLRSGDATRVDRSLIRLFGSSDGVETQMSRASALLDSGLVDMAQAELPHPQAVLQMSLPQLHRHLGLVDLLADRSALRLHLLAARQRLRLQSVGHLHDVNFAARVVQYSNVVESFTTVENARAAFEISTQRGGGGTLPSVEPRVAVLLAFNDDRVGAALLAPLSRILASANVPIFQLQDSRLGGAAVKAWPHSPLLAADARSVRGVVQAPTEYFREWDIDLEAGIAKCDGLDLFEGIYEAVARTLKVFDVDWSLPATKRWADKKLLQMDRTVHALELVRAAAESRDLSIRLVSLQSHFAPHYALRAFCRANSDRFEHVTLAASYENWRTNLAGGPLSTLTLLNNTREPAPAMPAFGPHNDFDEFYQGQFTSERERYAALARDLTSQERAGSNSEEAAKWISAMRSDRANGKRVLCVLGKIPYDLAVPYQGGPAHSSMKDWLQHTIDCAEGADVAIYVKPHPHELNLSISAKTIQSFTDLYNAPMPAHARVLPHRGLNVQDLIPVVDLFLVWNGSSIAELGMQGASVLAADDWAALNYPINVSLPHDRHDYERIIRGEREINMHSDFRELSEAYVCYLTEAPFALPFPFVTRSSTNTEFNLATVDLTRLDDAGLAPLHDRRSDILHHFGLSGSKAKVVR